MTDEIRRPHCEQAAAFLTTRCSDPLCGIHLIAQRSGGEPICEIVVGRTQLLGLLGYIHDAGLDLPIKTGGEPWTGKSTATARPRGKPRKR